MCARKVFGTIGLRALIALTLAGCASPQGKFRSQKDPSYNEKIGRVLVVYYNVDTTSSLGRGFSDRFATRVAALLTQKSVPSEIVRMEREALDRNAPVKAATARFRPRQFLSFAVTRVDSMGGVHQAAPGQLLQFSSEMSATFEFSLADAQSGRTVWRTEAHYYSPPRAEDVADQLLEQLRVAGLF